LVRKTTELHLLRLKGLLENNYVEELGYQIEAIPYNSENKTRRYNSTIDLNYSIPQLGENQNIHLSKKSYLFGVSLNMAKTHCPLQIKIVSSISGWII
jgi:hypothetical protein